MKMSVFFLKTGAVDESTDPPEVDLHLTSEDIEVVWVSGRDETGPDSVHVLWSKLEEEINRIEAKYADDPHFRWIPAVTGRHDLRAKLVKAAHKCLEYEQEKSNECRCESPEGCAGCCQEGLD